MYSLKEASTEYVAALDETEKKLSSCPSEVGIIGCIVTSDVTSQWMPWQLLQAQQPTEQLLCMHS